MKQETVLKKPTVSVGQELRVVVEGRGAKDLYVKIDGYILFLKHVPEEYADKLVIVRVTNLLPKCGFAEYKDKG